MAAKTSKKWSKSDTYHHSENYNEQLAFDSACHNEGLKQAVTQAWKNMYLAQIRKDPSSVMGPTYTTKLLELQGGVLEDEAHRATPVHLLTFNPNASAGDEDIISAYALSIANHMRKYKWILAFDLCVEVDKEGRPHMHFVLHIKEKRWPSDIKAQLWAMMHNQYHRHTYGRFIRQEDGHNAKHLDLRPCPTKADINRARAYILKGWESEKEKYWETGIVRYTHGTKRSKLLFPDSYSEVEEKEIVEENLKNIFLS